MALGPDQMEARGRQIVKETCLRNNCIYSRRDGSCAAGASPEQVVQMFDQGKGCGAAATPHPENPRDTVMIGVMNKPNGFQPTGMVIFYNDHRTWLKQDPSGVLFYGDGDFTNQASVK